MRSIFCKVKKAKKNEFNVFRAKKLEKKDAFNSLQSENT